LTGCARLLGRSKAAPFTARLKNRHQEVHAMNVPTHSHIRRLLAAINPRSPFGPRNRALVVLAVNTGLRVGELCGLDVDQVASRGQVHHFLYLRADQVKGHRGRQCPLNTRARKAIATILAFNRRRGLPVGPGLPLLVDRHHRRLSTREVQRFVQQARERAGLDVPITPHSLRHFFATRLLDSGRAATRHVQVALGHARLTSTEVYAHAQPAVLADLIETMA